MLTEQLNQTHSPTLRSWVQSANEPGTDFPIQNLPFGRFRRHSGQDSAQIGVAIGNHILDLSACYHQGLLASLPAQLQEACLADRLNPIMALGAEASQLLRREVSTLLAAGASARHIVKSILVPMAKADLLLPCDIGDYTDFYASIAHATNVGSLFRPEDPLLPNYRYVPVAYHGRASSLVISPTPIQRPQGQWKSPEQSAPGFGPSKMLDYEVEVGCFIGAGNRQGDPIAIADAESHIFGLCLVNDWSARDIQAWEYQPLGPFLGKSFATTLSPWVVTLEALAPFRCPAYPRGQHPQPLPYLNTDVNQHHGGIRLTVEVSLCSAQMGAATLPPVRLSQASFQEMYWTLAQMVTHHTSNGCNLRTGDLLASGTVSGQQEGTQGSLLEITRRGAQPITLPTGEIRSFLAEGDEVILRAFCESEGFVKIGFGHCRGTIINSKKSPS